MKKIKMWYIKLAFAALFFLLIAEIINLKTHTGITTIPIAYSAATSTDDLQTVALADAITAANTTVSNQDSQIPLPTNLISVKGKRYLYNLVIPKIGVNVGVLPMGITDDGRMAVPNNYTEVGWYSLGYRPGETGSAVMGAHVDNGGTIDGVFKNLKKLSVGDNIYIGDGDGHIYHYQVTQRKIYDYQTAITTEVFSQNDAQRLNLITCYGTWLPKENTYNQRLVVFAELVNTQQTAN